MALYGSSGNPITEILINGVWTDVSTYVRGDDAITINRGRQNEQSRTSAQSCNLTLNNRDGRFSSRNPSSPYYGLLPRNTQMRVSAGTGAGDAYLRIPYDDQGVLNRSETANKAVLGIVGDLEIRVDVWPHTWRPGNSVSGTPGSMILASKYVGTGNQRGWALYLSWNGVLTFVWSVDGTSGTRVFSTSTVAVPASSGRLSIKATMDVDNGAAGNTVAFYTSSTIGGTYTQLGASVVTAGVTSIFNSTAKLCAGGGDEVAGIFTGTNGFGGKFYEMQIYQGIAGTLRANPKFYAQSVGTTSFSDGLGTPNTWTHPTGARITSDRIRFWGELSSLPQYWDKTGRDIYAQVTAAGMIRRLTQGSSPLRSPIYRNFTQYAPHGYWSFEDESQSTSAASAVSGGSSAKVTAVTFDDATDLPGAQRTLAFTAASSKIIGAANTVATTGTASFVFYVKLSSLPASQKTFLALYTTGTAAKIEIGIEATAWHIDFYDAGGTNLGSSVTSTTGINPTNQWVGYNLLLQTSGSNLTYSVRWDAVGVSFGGIGPTTIATAAPGRFKSFTLAAYADTAFNDAEFGHVFMSTQNLDLSTTAFRNASKAYTGETAADRIARLASEEGIAVQIDGFYAPTPTMGYQTVATFIDLIYECADADMGALCEARDALALSYRTRRDLDLHRDVTLSYSSHHLAEVPLPTEDDANVVNDQTVSRPKGSSARYIKSSGALSTAAPPNGIGIYDASTDLNLATDTALYNAAGWLVHLGTWDEARFPNLTIGMHRSVLTANSTLSEQLRAMDVGWTAALSGLPSWLPPDSVPLLWQGYTEELRKFLWTITANTSPAGPYNTAVYGDTDVVGTPRWDTAGSTLNAGITSSATALALTFSTTGNNWTTTVGSYPFDVMIGGERITLTSAPGGSTSPQSFTGVTRSVNGVVKAQLAGTAVKLADTRYYAR